MVSTVAERLECLSTLNSHKIMGDFMIYCDYRQLTLIFSLI